MPDAYMLLQNGMRNLKVVGVLSMHFDAVDQLVAVGEVLLVVLLLEFGHGYNYCSSLIDFGSPTKYEVSHSLVELVAICRLK